MHSRTGMYWSENGACIHVLGCTGLRMGHADSHTGMYWSENGACIHVLGCTGLRMGHAFTYWDVLV